MSRLTSTNPADNYSVVGEVTISTDKEIADKVSAAHAAKKAWRDLGVANRAALLRPIQAEIERRSEEIAELICRETGKALHESRAEVQRYNNEEFAWFLDHAEEALADEITLHDDVSDHRIVYEPYGVAAAIAPWNFPFGMAIWGIFQNLLAGNTVVFKTSEECPLAGKLLEEIITNNKLPDGVFAEVYGAGDVGKKLAESKVNLIWFTGSTKVGQSLYKTAAEKFIKPVLEMGGSSPCVVFEDVDVAQSALVIFGGRFRNNGQVCSAMKRLIVHESIADEVARELAKIIAKQKVGEPLREDTTLGSLVAERQQVLLQAQLQDALDKGAKVSATAKVDSGVSGAFFAPVLLTNVTKDMRVWKEEVFGPILPIVTFKTEEEAIELANDTDYGLTARVMSADLERAERVAGQIDAGTVSLNLEARFAACDPFGGYKLSGIGRERGIHGLRELCQIKVIQKAGQELVEA